MFARICLVLFISFSFLVMPQQEVEAKFFLTNALEKISNVLDTIAPNSSSSSSYSNSPSFSPKDDLGKTDKKDKRWILIHKGKYYDTYADRRSLKATGEAQDRAVEGYFKRVYNPYGSQKLGRDNPNRVKPDVITYSIAYLKYGTKNLSNMGLSRDYRNQEGLYYDVHNNLIYRGQLDYPYFETILPNSEDEEIRDTLFRGFGWDY